MPKLFRFLVVIQLSDTSRFPMNITGISEDHVRRVTKEMFGRQLIHTKILGRFDMEVNHEVSC